MAKLMPSIEQMILCSIINGHADLKLAKREELSRTGQFIYDGVSRLLKKRKAPFPKSAVVAAAELVGGEPEVLGPFVSDIFKCGTGREASDLLEEVRENQLLIDVVNMAGQQMGTGFNRQEFLELFENRQSKSLSPVSSFFQGNEKYSMPRGIPLDDLPKLNAATHGFYGVWALAGDSGVGKSTLALEIAIQVGREIPVLIYDYENGQPLLLAHITQIYRGDNKQVRKATKNLYFRDSIRTLDSDLAALDTPCLIVVDSIQKIGVKGGDDKRASVDKYVHRLEALKLLGHHVLMVSEKSRSFYGRTGQAGYKESGEIEYTVDVGVELLGIKDSNMVECSINKNRNWPITGFVSTMYRHNNWWWKEVTRRGRPCEKGRN